MKVPKSVCNCFFFQLNCTYFTFYSEILADEASKSIASLYLAFSIHCCNFVCICNNPMTAGDKRLNVLSEVQIKLNIIMMDGPIHSIGFGCSI